MDYATFLFQHSVFWEMLAIFDTVAMLGTLAVLSLAGPAIASGQLLLAAMGMTYIVGRARGTSWVARWARFWGTVGRIKDW